MLLALAVLRYYLIQEDSCPFPFPHAVPHLIRLLALMAGTSWLKFVGLVGVLVNAFGHGEELRHPLGPVGRRRSLVDPVVVVFAGLMRFPQIVHLSCLLNVGIGIGESWSTVVMLFD